MVLTLAAQPISLEAPIGEDEQRLGDFIEDERASRLSKSARTGSWPRSRDLAVDPPAKGGKNPPAEVRPRWPSG